MITFNKGDLIYFLDSVTGKVSYGVCNEVIQTGSTITYVLTLPNGSNLYLDSSLAYPSGLNIATPTPTPSTTPSITVSRTVAATMTPTMTVSPSDPNYPNIFSSTDSTAWQSDDGTVSVKDNGLVFKSTNHDPKKRLTFTRTFTVSPNKPFNFSFDYEQGTIRYAKIKLEANTGLLFSSARAFINRGNILVFGLFGDSGRFEADLFMPAATTLTMTISFYTDSNFDTSPLLDFDYRMERTLFRQVYQPPVSLLTPTPSLTPSQTATITPTVTPTLTPVYIPLTGYARMVISDNPLIYYKFDETVGNAVIDYSGNNINGTYHNVLLGQPPIVNGSGYSAGFGQNAQPSYVVTNNDNRYKNIQVDFSFEISINSKPQPHDAVIAWLPTTAGNSVFKLSVESGFLVFHLSTASGDYVLNSNVSVTDGVDRLISGVRQGNIIQLYINGSLISTLNVSGNNITSRNFIYVGGLVSDASDNYTGIIDDFSFYRYALSSFQIQNHYVVWLNSGGTALTPTPTPSTTPSTDGYKTMIIASSPIAYYRLDEPSGTYAYDSINNKHNGVSNGQLSLGQPSLLKNYPDAATGNFGNGIISVKQNSNDLSFAGSDFTFEFLISASSTQIATTPTIFNKIVDPTQNVYNYRFYLDPNGAGIFSVFMNGQEITLSTIDPINDDISRFIHIVRSGRTLTLLINGVAISTATIGGSSILDTANNDFEMFSSSYVDDHQFIGTLDEFAIYNYSLSSAVISQHVNQGFVVTPTPTPARSNTPTPSPTRTVTPSITVSPTISVTPSFTPTISITPSVTSSISVTPSITPTISITASVTPTLSFSATPTVTPTQTITVTPSVTPTISVSPTISVTPSVTPTISVTPSVTPTISITPSVTPTISISPTISLTPSITPTNTITITPTHTSTLTVTPTLTSTSTITPTPSVTPTISVTTTRIYDPNAQIILNSLHNWWDFNEAASANKIDSKDGVLLVPTNVGSGLGVVGNAVSFNPISYPTSRLESTISENILNYGNTDFTVGAFIKLNYTMLSQISYNQLSIMSRWSANQKQFQLGYDKSLDKVFFSISDNGDNVQTVYSNVTVGGSTAWLSVVASYDSQNHFIQIALNGNPPTTQSYTSTYYGVTQSFMIGNDGYLDSCFTGLIDSAFVCLRVLTAPQINWYYNNGAGTDYNRVLANAYYVDKGELNQYYDGTSLSAFTNVGGIVDNSLGNPQPSFTYGNSNYSYNNIPIGKFFQRILYDVYLHNNTTADVFFATDNQGSGSYLTLTSDSTKLCGISSSLDWTDFNDPSAISSFAPLSPSTWHNVQIIFDYLDNVMYASVYIDTICKVYYYLIPDTNMYFGMSGDLSSGTISIDNLQVYTEVTPPSITPTPTPTTTMTPTVTVTQTVTPTISVTPSVTATITSTITPTPTQTVSISNSPTPSPTISITASVTPTPSVTKTPIPSPTPSVTASISVSTSPTVTPTKTITPTASITPTPSVTGSVTGTVTPTPTPTVTATMTPTPSPSLTPGAAEIRIQSLKRQVVKMAPNASIRIKSIKRQILKPKT